LASAFGAGATFFSVFSAAGLALGVAMCIL
jgi:hypothetical protein